MRDKTNIDLLASMPRDDGVSLDDFYAYMPMHCYVYAPSREMWPASSVNARIAPIPGPNNKEHAGEHVARSAQSRGANVLVPRAAFAGPRPAHLGRRLDRAPRGELLQSVSRADARAGRRRQRRPLARSCTPVFGDNADHIVRWLAQRVQRPDEKINHALVLGGNQGIGKDTALEPVKHAVGPWNFFEVSPQHVLGRFNGFLKSVILRVNEARDLGEFDRFHSTTT